jgi:hypothetical protein
MASPPLIELAETATLGRADQRIRSTPERPATFNAITLDPRMRFAIDGPTLGIYAFPVPIAPVLRRRTMAFPAAGRAAEMHVTVAREFLERKPFAAPRALLLRDGLNFHFCDTFSVERLFRRKLDGGLQTSMFSMIPVPLG